MIMNKSNFEISDQSTLILFEDGSRRCKGFYDFAENVESSYLLKVHDGEETISNVNNIIDCGEKKRVGLISDVVNIAQKHSGTINIDVSILSRFELLFLLRMIYEVGRFDDLQILYSEPGDYSTDQYQKNPVGIKKISSIPGFVNKAPLNKKIVLILFLGFEPARSMAIYDHIDPDETYLIIPDPPYYSEWMGRSERMNASLIDTVRSENILRMHSSDHHQFERQFEELANAVDIGNVNCRISPLSTKPQSLGLFNYWRQSRGDFSLIYCSLSDEKKLYDPVGIGEQHILKEAE